MNALSGARATVPSERRREPPYFAGALALSAVLHGMAFWLGYGPARPAHPAVELDLTASGHVGRLSAPRPAAAPPAATPAPKAPEKEWVKPTIGQTAPVPTKPSEPEKPEPPAPAGPPGPPSSGEYGEGDGSIAQVTKLPMLLNLGDLSAILRRFYPEAARDERREGTVVIDLHVDTTGRVTSVDIARSASQDFDQAARRVGLLLRFSPAYKGAEKVPVRLRQAIRFNLEK
jgi:protein TonB